MCRKKGSGFGQGFKDKLVGLFESRGDSRGIFSSGLGEVGFSAPAAAHERCHLFDDISSMESEGGGFRAESANQGATIGPGRSENKGAGTGFAPEFGGGVAESVGLGAGNMGDQNADA
jgi:hypothetical protein